MAETLRVMKPVVNLRDAHSGKIQRQLLYGEGFCVEQNAGESVVGHRLRDGYHGVLDRAALGAWHMPSHRVQSRSAQLYAADDLKSEPVMTLPMQAQLCIMAAQSDRFYQTPDGYIAKTQVSPVTDIQPDIVQTARCFLDVPYLWGGNSIFGIDCSGLIAASLFAAGIDCPADSGAQCTALGQLLGDDAPPMAGDLIFWTGHVAMMVDETHIIHANAHYMKVTIDPLAQVAARIKTTEGKDISRRRRLDMPAGMLEG